VQALSLCEGSTEIERRFGRFFLWRQNPVSWETETAFAETGSNELTAAENQVADAAAAIQPASRRDGANVARGAKRASSRCAVSETA
jgi:hypothetical protein